MALDVGVLDTIHEEVTSNHCRIVVPQLEVRDWFVVDRGEAECLSRIINRVTLGDGE